MGAQARIYPRSSRSPVRAIDISLIGAYRFIRKCERSSIGVFPVEDEAQPRRNVYNSWVRM